MLQSLNGKQVEERTLMGLEAWSTQHRHLEPLGRRARWLALQLHGGYQAPSTMKLILTCHQDAGSSSVNTRLKKMNALASKMSIRRQLVFASRLPI